MIHINDRAGAQAPKELSPVHPECKVIFKFQVLAGAKELRKRGDFLEAEKLMDGLLSVFREGPHHKS